MADFIVCWNQTEQGWVYILDAKRVELPHELIQVPALLTYASGNGHGGRRFRNSVGHQSFGRWGEVYEVESVGATRCLRIPPVVLPALSYILSMLILGLNI